MKSPFLNIAECAEYLRFVEPITGALQLQATRVYLDRHKVPTFRRGRAILVRREDLDKTISVRRAS